MTGKYKLAPDLLPTLTVPVDEGHLDGYYIVFHRDTHGDRHSRMYAQSLPGHRIEIRQGVEFVHRCCVSRDAKQLVAELLLDLRK